MRNIKTIKVRCLVGFVWAAAVCLLPAQVGVETSGYLHLQNGDEHVLPLDNLLARGSQSFAAIWTVEEGGGRPQTDGTGGPLADPTSPLVFPRNFNRVSAMDSNGCAGCHNLPFAGGGGDFVTGVFVAGQRFDSATFDHDDGIPLRGSVAENGGFATLRDVGNYRATVGMFGSGYIEMLARQMTSDLQAIRDALPRGGSAALETKGVSLLEDEGWIYTEPNPYNPPGNLQAGQAPSVSMDLSDQKLPGRRLRPVRGVVWVPAFTDLKLHDITSGPNDPNREPLDINAPGGSEGFFAGNGRFLTKKLWGAASERPYFHHGKYTTLREATLAHAGEAIESRNRFLALSAFGQDQIIEFLKSLQILPANVKAAVVDERGRPRSDE